MIIYPIHDYILLQYVYLYVASLWDIDLWCSGHNPILGLELELGGDY